MSRLMEVSQKNDQLLLVSSLSNEDLFFLLSSFSSCKICGLSCFSTMLVEEW